MQLFLVYFAHNVARMQHFIVYFAHNVARMQHFIVYFAHGDEYWPTRVDKNIKTQKILTFKVLEFRVGRG